MPTHPARARAAAIGAAAIILAALPAILGGCSFDFPGQQGVAIATPPIIHTATPRPTPTKYMCAGAAEPGAPYHYAETSRVYWGGPDTNWHVEKYVLYDEISGAYCGSYALAYWAQPGTVQNDPAAPSWQVCAWLDGQQPSCRPAFTPEPGVDKSKSLGNAYGGSFPTPPLVASYDAATGRMVGVTPCLVAHMTFSRYPGVELTVTQCDKTGRQ